MYFYFFNRVSYADMLKKVEPLREELHSLEVQADENKKKGEEMKALIAQLERSIAAYKEEYAKLISQAQAIKADLENVQANVCIISYFYKFLYLYIINTTLFNLIY